MNGTGASFKSRSPAVICDFDDTTAIENVAELLLTEFGGQNWLDFRRQHSRRLITLKEYQERAFLTISAGREEMKALVKERVNLRPHFKSLFEYCKEANIPLAIASMGLDFYVEALLEREGMESIPSFTADTQFTSTGMSFGYRYTWDGCWQPGNCKCRVLQMYRDQGHSIFFAGDGKSDICPAGRSDVVFARRYLEDHYRGAGLPYIPLTDFSPLLNALQSANGSSPDPGAES